MDLKPFEELKGIRVAVGMSGGVDSSTVFALLAEAGAIVMGVTMKIWREKAPALDAVGAMELPSAEHSCYGPGKEASAAAAAELCAKYGAEHRIIDLAPEYEALVLEPFIREYRAGRTPNPCIFCNPRVKFGLLIERALESCLRFDCFLTGHYARIEDRAGIPTLRKAAHESKDQSYFLYRLPPATLARLRFPLGASSKVEVRAEARRLGLTAADGQESQDFIAGGYAPLFGPARQGDIVDESGKAIGRHEGIERFTIGQRRGLGVSTGPEALYVKALDAANNRVIVCKERSLYKSLVEGRDAISHRPEFQRTAFDAFVRIRQNHKRAAARVAIDGDRARIEFAEAQRAPAPGQSAAFYDADGFVIGGCVMD